MYCDEALGNRKDERVKTVDLVLGVVLAVWVLALILWALLGDRKPNRAPHKPAAVRRCPRCGSRSISCRYTHWECRLCGYCWPPRMR